MVDKDEKFLEKCKKCGVTVENPTIKTDTMEFNVGMFNHIKPIYYFECPNCKYRNRLSY